MIFKFFTVQCDYPDCDEAHEAAATTQRQAREFAAEDHWITVGSEDRCPDHAEWVDA